jgi:hypothetical protein
VETTKPATTARIYRSGHAEHTVLYRAFAQHFERFLLIYEEHFQERYGYLRRGVEPAPKPVPGPSLRLGARHQKRELLWADWAERDLLEDVPHRQGDLHKPRAPGPVARALGPRAA